MGDDADLIDAPRRVGKLTVNYASASKQVRNSTPAARLPANQI